MSKSIPFIFVRQSFFSRASPPLTALHKTYCFQGDRFRQNRRTLSQPLTRRLKLCYAISLMIVAIMCPVMSLVATVLFKEPSFGMWVHTWGCNMPMALCWQMLYCGPLSRFIFRLVFRRGKAENPAA